MKIHRLTLIGVLAQTLALSAVAQPPPGGETQGPPRPPKEAVEACAGRVAKAACGFTSPQGAVKGLCLAPPRLPLACVPDGAPRPPQR